MGGGGQLDTELTRVTRYFSIISVLLVMALALVVVREYRPAWKGEQTIAGKPWRQGLYEENCASCHGSEGEGRISGRAPAIGRDGFLVAASDDFIRRTVREGRPGTNMTALGRANGGVLSDALVDAIIQFMRSRQQGQPVLPAAGRVSGSPERGMLVYQQYCVDCHGAKGQGRVGPALNNPGFLGTASDQFIRETITRGRPGTPMSPYGQGKGGVAELSPREIDDLVSFIRQWEGSTHE